MQPREAAAVDASATALFAEALVAIGQDPGADFEGDEHLCQVGGAVCIAVQALLRSAAKSAPDFDLLAIMRALGLGLGAQLATVSDTDLWRLLETFGEGIATGRVESASAAINMETKGSA